MKMTQAVKKAFELGQRMAVLEVRLDYWDFHELWYVWVGDEDIEELLAESMLIWAEWDELLFYAKKEPTYEDGYQDALDASYDE